MIIIEAISVSNLSKYFSLSRKARMHSNSTLIMRGQNKEVKAVDGINFQVQEGEIFGFLGPNGAGKTTTIRMMTGVLRPTNGKIQIFGKDAWQEPLVVKQLLGNVPEEANVYIELSGWHNLMLIGELYGIPKKERKEKAEFLLKEFELFQKRYLKAKKYSKGMKQRLLLCMSLMGNPKILFLDEPTSGLDIQSARIIKKLILEYNEKGMTIFLTTHDMDVANELCDRIAIINKGKIIGLDTPDILKALVQEYQAIDLSLENGTIENEISKLKAIREIQVINGGFHIIVDEIHDSICEIIEYIKSKNLRIKSITTNQPKLEETFIKIIEKGENVE